jgi:hypothetical protein
MVRTMHTQVVVFVSRNTPQQDGSTPRLFPVALLDTHLLRQAVVSRQEAAQLFQEHFPRRGVAIRAGIEALHTLLNKQIIFSYRTAVSVNMAKIKTTCSQLIISSN